MYSGALDALIERAGELRGAVARRLARTAEAVRRHSMRGLTPSGGGAREEPIWRPGGDAVERSQMTAFTRFCAAKTGRDFPDHAALHRFSIEKFSRFWQIYLEWSELRREGDPFPACTSDSCEKANFFPNLRLNYAENLIESGADEQVVVTSLHADAETRRLTRGELRRQVYGFMASLRALGVQPGDRIVAVAHNSAEATIACLAVTGLGAIFSASSPDLGAFAMLSRFTQLSPTLLLCHLNDAYEGVRGRLHERVAEVARSLPTLSAVIALDNGLAPGDLQVPLLSFAALASAEPKPGFAWQRFPFNHPLFILFSSGTTGAPKCIVHGAGGTLLEHSKEQRLHCDLRSGDKLFFQTSTGWMMWNWQLSALATGCEIVHYDGPVGDPETLWRLAAQERVTVFGTNPGYLQYCADAGFSPAAELDLTPLRAVLSTGSILFDRQFDWAKEHVKDVPLQSISGGTDIIGCFVLGNPNLPVYRGEIQSKSLGLDVRALSQAGGPPADLGELVCANPFPSRPLGFFADEDGVRFHQAYFSQNPGVWTHGDFVEFTARGSARIHGRSDGVLNIRGIRVGPAEIYRILQDIPEVRQAMAVEQTVKAGPDGTRLVLLLVLQAGLVLDGSLTLRIKKEISRRGSQAHVPAVIAQVDALPTTHSGKYSETAARDALNGRQVNNLEALKNPECLDALRSHAALRVGGGMR
jgi:acetoacetyl-CoA synthetase